MGGKGRRRREKNFLAAHGGNTRLPPAPKPSDVDAIPCKLRRLMEFKNPSVNQRQGSLKTSKDDAKTGRKREDGAGRQKLNSKDDYGSDAAEFKEAGTNKNAIALIDGDDGADIGNKQADNKGKGKRKRKAFDDLRFQKMSQELAVAAGLKRKDRKKNYLEAKKKKQQNAKTVESLDFPKYEKIKFGEVVEAPPKLTFPKASKSNPDASHERLRLQAVEAYRKRKGWVSRPGIHLPPINETPSS